MELSCTTMAGDELVQLSGIPGDLSLIQAVEMLKEGRHLVDWLQEKGRKLSRNTQKFVLPDARSVNRAVGSVKLSDAFGLQLAPWMSSNYFQWSELRLSTSFPMSSWCSFRRARFPVSRSGQAFQGGGLHGMD